MPPPGSKGFAHTPVARPHASPSGPPSSSLGRSDRLFGLIAVLVGVMWSIGAIDLNAPTLERMGLLVVGIALGVAGYARVDIGLPAGLYAVAVGGVERLQRDLLEGGSDVLRATQEAIGVLLRGQDPYDHVFVSTDPIGSPFVYPPGELFFYLPADRIFGEIGRVETWAGILTIAALVVAGARVGAGRAALVAMLYATWGIAAFRTTDGGNDVSGALLVVIALVALAFASRPGRRGAAAFALSAVAFGWAIAFKQFALLLWPFALRHLAAVRAPWRRYLAISGGVAAAMTLPFVLWGPGAFVRQQLAALTFHQDVWGANLLNTAAQLGPVDDLVPVFFALEIFASVVAAALALRARPATIGAGALIGAALLAVPLLLARWTTQSYLVYAATAALAGLALVDVAADRPEGTRLRSDR